MAEQMKSKTESKKMGLWMATIIGMNAMIGASIFVIPEQLQKIVGPAGIISYLYVIAAVWFLAYSLARVAEYYSTEGSFFAFVGAWAGKKVGLVAAASYCIGLSVALGLLTRLTGIYLHTLFPAIAPEYLSTGILAALTLTLLAGTQIMRAGQILLIICTIAPLIIITLLCAIKGSVKNLTPFMPYGFQSTLTATKVIVFGFLGFEAVVALYNVVENPKKTVPKAITGAIAAVSILYLLFVAATFYGIPHQLFAQSNGLSDVLYKQFPSMPWLISMIIWSIIITIMGTIHAMLWSISSLIMSLVRQSGIKIPVTTNMVIVALSILVWLMSVGISSLDLFFNLTVLCNIPPMAASIVPLAFGKIPTSRFNQVIATLGLLTAAIMCYYAAEGIITHFLS